jgi:hypothetical protein
MVIRRWQSGLGVTIALASLGAGCSDQPSPGGATGGIAASAGSGAIPSAGTGGGAGSMLGSGGMAGAAGSAGSGGMSAGASGASGAAGAAGASGAAGTGGGGPVSTEKFSFFVTGMKSLLDVAKAHDPALTEGFGGDLTYGETGPGAGLRGADKICTAIAELSMPGNNKRWRAFLSATAGEDGMPVNAIDRIGTGPWYDRTGRVVAMNLQGLAGQERPQGDAAIAEDLPNEFGIPNHEPDVGAGEVDNHDTLTGSNADGELKAEGMGDTCNDWTSRVGNTGRPQCGHSWPRSANNGRQWIEDHEAPGCAPGINIMSTGGAPQGNVTVGGGGGYGGFYCFSLDP